MGSLDIQNGFFFLSIQMHFKLFYAWDSSFSNIFIITILLGKCYFPGYCYWSWSQETVLDKLIDGD